MMSALGHSQALIVLVLFWKDTDKRGNLLKKKKKHGREVKPYSNEKSEITLVQSFSHVQLFTTPWTAELQASLSITNSQSILKLMSIELVMPFNHLILCRPLLFLPLIFPSIRVFSSESVLSIRWPKYWSFSFSISPSNE